MGSQTKQVRVGQVWRYMDSPFLAGGGMEYRRGKCFEISRIDPEVREVWVKGDDEGWNVRRFEDDYARCFEFVRESFVKYAKATENW